MENQINELEMENNTFPQKVEKFIGKLNKWFERFSSLSKEDQNTI